MPVLVAISCVSSSTIEGRARASAPGRWISMRSVTVRSVTVSPVAPVSATLLAKLRKESDVEAARAAAAAAETAAPRTYFKTTPEPHLPNSCIE